MGKPTDGMCGPQGPKEEAMGGLLTDRRFLFEVVKIFWS